MNYLIDTHTFLWWVADDDQLSLVAREIIADKSNIIFFSIASAWEIAIKYSSNKLILQDEPEEYITSRLESNKFESLTIQLSHVLKVADLLQ